MMEDQNLDELSSSILQDMDHMGMQDSHLSRIFHQIRETHGDHASTNSLLISAIRQLWPICRQQLLQQSESKSESRSSAPKTILKKYSSVVLSSSRSKTYHNRRYHRRKENTVSRNTMTRNPDFHWDGISAQDVAILPGTKFSIIVAVERHQQLSWDYYAHFTGLTFQVLYWEKGTNRGKTYRECTASQLSTSQDETSGDVHGTFRPAFTDGMLKLEWGNDSKNKPLLFSYNVSIEQPEDIKEKDETTVTTPTTVNDSVFDHFFSEMGIGYDADAHTISSVQHAMANPDEETAGKILRSLSSSASTARSSSSLSIVEALDSRNSKGDDHETNNKQTTEKMQHDPELRRDASYKIL